MSARVAIYARVSTTKQDNENQLTDLHEFVTKQNWQLYGDYVDVESGGKSARAEFQRMLDDASQRKFDLVLFWALDRFSREGVLQTLTHLSRLESYGVGFKSYTEPFFDSCGIFKDAVISIMATLAKQSASNGPSAPKPGWRLPRPVGRFSDGHERSKLDRSMLLAYEPEAFRSGPSAANSASQRGLFGA
jgi:hypothetical protein